MYIFRKCKLHPPVFQSNVLSYIIYQNLFVIESNLFNFGNFYLLGFSYGIIHFGLDS